MTILSRRTANSNANFQGSSVFALTVILCSAACLRGQGIPTLTVCQILSDPLRYNGQMVQIRDRMASTSEGIWFKGYDCPGVMRTGDFVWDSLIVLTFPGNTLRSEYAVDFQFDEDSGLRLIRKQKERFRRIPFECLVFTYTGLYETRRDWDRWIYRWPGGQRTLKGFGHLDAAPAQLIVRSGDGITALEGCKATSAGPGHRK